MTQLTVVAEEDEDAEAGIGPAPSGSGASAAFGASGTSNVSGTGADWQVPASIPKLQEATQPISKGIHAFSDQVHGVLNVAFSSVPQNKLSRHLNSYLFGHSKHDVPEVPTTDGVGALSSLGSTDRDDDEGRWDSGSIGEEDDQDEHGLEADLVLEDEPWSGVLEFLNDTVFADVDAHVEQGNMDMSGKFKCWWFQQHLRILCRKPRSFEPVGDNEALHRVRNVAGKVVLSPFVAGLVMSLICLDICLTFFKYLQGSMGVDEGGVHTKVFFATDVLMLAVFSLEVGGRVVYEGPRFTHSMLNLLEFCLVPVMCFSTFTNGGVNIGVPPPVLRFVRPILRGINIVGKAGRGFRHAVKLRRMLQEQFAGSHRRYRSDGFDLDLCYITDQFIAMGRPASGKDAVTHNSLHDLAYFLQKMHARSYLVINATDNYTYSPSFLCGRVLRFPVASGSVPSLERLWELCTAIEQVTDRDEHVVAVHAYDDDGRVGLVAAAWLLFSEAFFEPSAAMSHYERGRTAVGAPETVIGYESASQRRYVEYFATCVHRIKAVPSPARRVKLKSLRILGLAGLATETLRVRVFSRDAEGFSPLEGDPSVRHMFHLPLHALRTMDVALCNTGTAGLNHVPTVEEEEALMLMMDEETFVSTARQKSVTKVLDDTGAGCRPHSGMPVFDTADGARKSSSGTVQRECLETAVWWKFMDVFLCGEVCFEVHRGQDVGDEEEEHKHHRDLHQRFFTASSWVSKSSLEAGRRQPSRKLTSTSQGEGQVEHGRRQPSRKLTSTSQGSGQAAPVKMPDDTEHDVDCNEKTDVEKPPAPNGHDFEEKRRYQKKEEETQILFAAWFHTSLLELSRSMDVRHTDERTVAITLKREDVDKGLDAPSLANYGSAFSMQLIFEVDEPMDTTPHDGGQRALRRRSAQPEDDDMADLLRLHPPSALDGEVSAPCSLGWLTWCIERLWEPTEAALEKLIREQVEPQLKEAVPKALSNISFPHFKLGSQKPKLGPVVASRRDGKTSGLQLDLALKYEGDVHIEIDAGIVRLGINSLVLKGTLSILFDPIVKSLPIVGGIKFFFLNPPHIDLGFVGLAEMVNFPFLHKMVHSVICDALSGAMVLPNVICLSWMPDRAAAGEPTAWLASALPNGVLRLAIMEIKGLGQEYHKVCCRITLGAQLFRTGSRRKGQHTTEQWFDTFDICMYDMKQFLSIEIWGESHMGSSEKLIGTTEELEVQRLVSRKKGQSVVFNPVVDKAKRRRSKKPPKGSGRIKLNASIFHLVNDAQFLDKKEPTAEPIRTASGMSGSSTPSTKSSAVSGNMLASTLGRSSLFGQDQAGGVGGSLLVLKVMKGRLPASKMVGASLHVRTGSQEAERQCKPLDDSWKQHPNITDHVIETVDVLVREGFTSEKIAEVLKLETALVSKVVAHCREFNVDVPQHICVMVPPHCVEFDHEVDLEVRRKGRVEAHARLRMVEMMAAPKMTLRKIISFTPGAKAAKKRSSTPGSQPSSSSQKGPEKNLFDFDLEMHLFALATKETLDAEKERAACADNAHDRTRSYYKAATRRQLRAA